MRLHITAILIASIACVPCFAQVGSPRPSAGGQSIPYVPVPHFDASRDVAEDISAAIAEAQRTQKRIILYVGGPWCPYCDQLETLFQKNPNLRQLRDAHFITVPVYSGSENKNDHALAAYTPVLGVPHFFVLASDGTLLHSQHMVELRANADYSPSKMQDFLERWRETPLATTPPHP